jgi:hypothetical protein
LVTAYVVAKAGAKEELRNVRIRKQRATLLHKLDLEDMYQGCLGRIVKV